MIIGQFAGCAESFEGASQLRTFELFPLIVHGSLFTANRSQFTLNCALNYEL